MAYPVNLRPLGYQQITGLFAVQGLTVPAGTAMALISCAGAAVRWRDDGVDPTAAIGYPLPIGGELVYAAAFSQIRFFEQVPGSILDICYYGA